MATYRNAPTEAGQMLTEIMTHFHAHLVSAGVKVALLFAHAGRDKDGEPRGFAITEQGARVDAKTKITSHKDRVAGMPDAVITVDGDAWDEWSVERQQAALDHELTHLELAVDDEGAVKTDDAFRPVLKYRHHDFQLGGFESIVERHKEHAPESIGYRDIHKTFTQQVFHWG